MLRFQRRHEVRERGAEAFLSAFYYPPKPSYPRWNRNLSPWRYPDPNPFPRMKLWRLKK